MTNIYKDTLFDLSGRCALVSGGAGLLGQEFCSVLCSAGADVVIADANSAAANALREELLEQFPGSRVVSLALDVTDKASVAACMERIETNFQRLDVLVNSAAVDPKFDTGSKVSQYVGFPDFPLAMWEESVSVNLTGMFLLTQQACKLMEKAGKGAIINLGSNYGLVGPDQRIYRRAGQEDQVFKPAVYSVCKAGIIGFTKYLSAYYAGTGIRVNVLTPSGVYNAHDPEFEGNYAARTVLRRMSRKNEFQGGLLFLASDASSYMTGSNLVIDGGWTAL